MTSVRILLLLMLALLVCESCKEPSVKEMIKPTVRSIACEEPGTRKVKIYKTTRSHPLYRGGWDFVTVDGKRVLSTCNCHFVGE